MPAMGGFNVPFFPPQMMQDPFIAPPPPIDPGEEKIILQALKNGHTANQWKDYYLDHKDRLDETISIYLNPPKVPLQAIKKPSPNAFKVEPSPARSLPPPKRQSSVQRPAQPASGKRNTINSLTAPAPVFGDRMPAPNADIQIPEPPSRSPTPPTVVIPQGRGNKYTPEDREFFLKFIAWRLKGDPSLSRLELCALLAEKAPHHTAPSWQSYWSNKHDVPDKILAAAKGEESTHDDESDTDEETRRVRRRPKYKDPSSDEEDEDEDEDEEESNAQSEPDEDEPVEVLSERDMGQKGEPFTDADLYITAKYTLTCPDFNNASARERWGPYSERYPQRSAKSWGEYYRRNEESITKLAKRIKKQGHDLSERRATRLAGPLASGNTDNPHQVKRKHDAEADLDADGEDDDEQSPTRQKRRRNSDG
ncbi:hypothetical protein H0H92_003512 [Tricholoma furcatifolium]|nr:hypothetical protein H0H92_003512 [Tricholoma furcatifolium]